MGAASAKVSRSFEYQWEFPYSETSLLAWMFLSWDCPVLWPGALADSLIPQVAEVGGESGRRFGHRQFLFFMVADKVNRLTLMEERR